jgi:hypothetical protein
VGARGQVPGDQNLPTQRHESATCTSRCATSKGTSSCTIARAAGPRGDCAGDGTAAAARRRCLGRWHCRRGPPALLGDDVQHVHDIEEDDMEEEEDLAAGHVLVGVLVGVGAMLGANEAGLGQRGAGAKRGRAEEEGEDDRRTWRARRTRRARRERRGERRRWQWYLGWAQA